MLRRVTHKTGTYDIVQAGRTMWGHPIMVVTNDLDPLIDLLYCRIPSWWEWCYRNTP